MWFASFTFDGNGTDPDFRFCVWNIDSTKRRLIYEQMITEYERKEIPRLPLDIIELLDENRQLCAHPSCPNDFYGKGSCDT